MKFYTIIFCAIVLISCNKQKNTSKAEEKETAKSILLQNMKTLAKNGIIFGHQDDLAYGVGWSYVDGESDVKKVVGDYPGVYGWDLGHLELGEDVNIDGVPFVKMKKYVTEVYKRGGINTFSWHQTNPFNRNSAWDSTSTIKLILKNAEVKRDYLKDLDKAAAFFNGLKDERGNTIPVIFRPLHEQTGDWFWWGKKQTASKDYIQLWRITVDYLKSKGVKNVLYAFSTTEFPNKEFFLERYPGDNYVDVLGFDAYQNDTVKTNSEFVQGIKNQIKMLNEIGKEHNKLTALTEIGQEKVPNKKWWTEILLPIVQNSNLSYVLLWRNGRPDHYFVPYPGQISENDFKTFYKTPKVIFQKELTKENIYNKK